MIFSLKFSNEPSPFLNFLMEINIFKTISHFVWLNLNLELKPRAKYKQKTKTFSTLELSKRGSRKQGFCFSSQTTTFLNNNNWESSQRKHPRRKTLNNNKKSWKKWNLFHWISWNLLESFFSKRVGSLVSGKRAAVSSPTFPGRGCVCDEQSPALFRLFFSENRRKKKKKSKFTEYKQFESLQGFWAFSSSFCYSLDV